MVLQLKKSIYDDRNLMEQQLSLTLEKHPQRLQQLRQHDSLLHARKLQNNRFAKI